MPKKKAKTKASLRNLQLGLIDKNSGEVGDDPPDFPDAESQAIFDKHKPERAAEWAKRRAATSSPPSSPDKPAKP